MERQHERLFLAIPIYPLFKKEIDTFCNPLIEMFPEWKWINLENAHITLYFFSQFPSNRKEELIKTSQEVLEKTEPFEIALKDFKFFKDSSTELVKVAWLGVLDSLDTSLRLLHRNLIESLNEQGVEIWESNYQPHVTLFRLNKTLAIDFNVKSCSFAETPRRKIEEVTLYRSDLTSNGSVYTKDWIYRF